MDLSHEERRLVARRKAQSLQGIRNPQRDYSEALQRLSRLRGTVGERPAIRTLELCVLIIQEVNEIRRLA